VCRLVSKTWRMHYEVDDKMVGCVHDRRVRVCRRVRRTVTYVEEDTAPANASVATAMSTLQSSPPRAVGEFVTRAACMFTRIAPRARVAIRVRVSQKVNGEPAAAIQNPTAIHAYVPRAPHERNLALRVTDPRASERVSYDLKDANICNGVPPVRRNVNTYVRRIQSS